MKKNSKNDYQKDQRNRLRSIISNSLSMLDKSELIDTIDRYRFFFNTIYYTIELKKIIAVTFLVLEIHNGYMI